MLKHDIEDLDDDSALYIRYRLDGSRFNIGKIHAHTKTLKQLFRHLLFADDAGFVAHTERTLQSLTFSLTWVTMSQMLKSLISRNHQHRGHVAEVTATQGRACLQNGGPSTAEESHVWLTLYSPPWQRGTKETFQNLTQEYLLYQPHWPPPVADTCTWPSGLVLHRLSGSLHLWGLLQGQPHGEMPQEERSEDPQQPYQTSHLTAVAVAGPAYPVSA